MLTKGPESPAAVDAIALLEEALEEIRPAAGIRGLILDARAPAGLTITVQPEVRLALRRLLLNAVRFTPAGWIEATAGPRRGTVALVVRDSGPGLDALDPEEVLSRSDSRLAHHRRALRAVGADLRLEGAAGGGVTATIEIRG